VRAPTLLLVGSADVPILPLNEEAADVMGRGSELIVIPGATHLFEEPGALEEVARLSAGWFVRHLPPRAAGS
jgi:pimeloyl-ACP methyl ester carboxylesterase